MEWIEDWENETLDPQDGGDVIYFWWDDMRRREIVELIKKVYERGFRAGKESK